MAITRFGIDGGIAPPWSGIGPPPPSQFTTRMGLSGGITRYARDFSGKSPSGITVGQAIETATAFPVIDASQVIDFIQAGQETTEAFPITFTQAPLITTVSSVRGTDIATANSTLTVNVDNSVGITSITVNGITLASIQIINSTEVTGLCPLSFNAVYGTTVDVTVSNGTSSPAHSVTTAVPLGMVETFFTVDYVNLDPDSPFSGDLLFSAITSGDSCVHSLFTTPGSNGVSMDGLGEFTLTGTIIAQQQFDYYIFDASDLTASDNIEQIFVEPGPVEAPISITTANDSAFDIVGQVVTAGTITQTLDTATALPVIDGSTVIAAIAQTNTIDTALPITGGATQIVSISIATEIGTAGAVSDISIPQGTISVAIETSTAFPVVDATAVIGSISQALEIGSAHAVTFPATLGAIQDQLTALQVSVNNLTNVIAAQQVLINELHIRSDLNQAVPNEYANDGSSIENSQFILNKINNGDGTFDITRT